MREDDTWKQDAQLLRAERKRTHGKRFLVNVNEQR
jgi:hypothetical protein